MRDEQAGASTQGLDIHGGLRIRLEYDKTTRTILARESAAAGVRVREDVEDYIAHLQQRVGLAQAWLIQWRRQQGEPMEAAR